MRPGLSITCVGMVIRLGLLCCATGCGADNPDSRPNADAAKPTSEVVIHRFCGDCHAFPQPDTYPLDAWPEKVREGFHFYHASLRTDLEVPAADAVEQYYLQRAPQTLEVIPSTLPDSTSFASVFAPAETFKTSQPLRAVSHLKAITDGDGPPQLLICDMRAGYVLSLPEMSQPQTSLVLAQCRNPCHVEPTDLDGNGTTDYVIGDLGSFLPEDHDFGAVWWVRPDQDGRSNKTPLVDGLGRVADVQPLDADADGDLDVLVAEFGWRETGRILLLRNEPAADSGPQMALEVIDERHGTIHIPVTDLNGDSHPDFVALISQEYEAVEAFLNRGDGSFERQVLFQSENPGFGSSGIQLADMDGDGDMDVAGINGDSLDTPIVKPYHSLFWLENTGEFPFVFHEISKLPGGYCVRAADIDSDGDIDLAAVTLIPTDALNTQAAGTFDSVVWFEQTTPGTFVGHSLERDNCQHAACELADWDVDGDLDLIVADMTNDPTTHRPLTIFRNQSKSAAAD